LTERFPSGELLFDTLSSIGPRLSKIFSKGIVKWGTGDVRELERWNPRLRFIEQASTLDGYQAIPYVPQRLLYRLIYATPARNYDVVNRFAF
jgi:hypothetical protein